MKILDILAWILLIIGVILLIWYLLGNSPTELLVILPFIFMLVFKLWSLSDNFIKFKSNTLHAFLSIKNETSEIKTQIVEIKSIITKNKKWSLNQKKSKK